MFAHFALAGVNRVAGFEEFPQLTLQAWECIKDDHCLVPSHLPNAYLINHSLRPTFDLYKGASHFDSKFVATLRKSFGKDRQHISLPLFSGVSMPLLVGLAISWGD